MNPKRAGVAWTVILFCAGIARAAVTLPQDFSTSQGTDAVYYESIGDSRSSNTQNPAPAGTSLMRYDGSGYPFYTGPLPTYTDSGNYPLIQNDSADGALLMSPGTGGQNLGTGTANIGASVQFQAATAGLYCISGSFARDNTNVGAGDGVDVLVVKNVDLDNPLFATSISPSNTVDYTNPFAGTGAAPFNLTVSLAAGDALRFVVFSDSQGQDGTYDTTAFRVAIAAADPTKPWQNPLNPLDVNGDGVVTPLDALIIINELNLNGSHSLTVPPPDPGGPPPFLDTDGDNSVSPTDVLQIVNFLNGDLSIETGFAPAASIVAVPEPSAAALAAVGLVITALAKVLQATRRPRAAPHAT